MSGIGRFRAVAFIAVFFLLKGIFLLIKADASLLTFSFAPILMVMLFQDVMEGPIFPLFSHISPILFLLSLFVLLHLETVAIKILRKEVEMLSGEHFFTVCPRCRYDQNALMDHCLRCNYKQGDPISAATSPSRYIMPPNRAILEEREHYHVQGLGPYMPPKALLFVELDPNEYILIAYRKPHGRSLLINEVMEVVSYIVFSTKKITLLHYHFDSEGWRFREIIPYDSIRSLSVVMKKHVAAKLPTLTIKAAGDIYELAFSPNETEMGKAMAMVKCIQNRVPGLDVEIQQLELPGQDVIDLMNTDLSVDVKDVFKSPWEK